MAQKVTNKPTKYKDSQRFLQLCDKYSVYTKDHAEYFKRDDPQCATFDDAVAKVRHKKKVYVNCNTPDRWAFEELGYSPYLIWSSHGSFSTTFRGDMTKKLKRITKGGPVGYTLKQAIKKKLLKPGDICTFKDHTHTFTYTGYKYTFYDAGSHTQKLGYNKKGMRVSNYHTYSNYKNRKIGEVLRWRSTPKALKLYKGNFPKILDRDCYMVGDGMSTLVHRKTEIKRVQKLLRWGGYYSGSIDGKYGVNTEDATRRFQKEYKLSVTGKFGSTELAMFKKIRR